LVVFDLDGTLTRGPTVCEILAAGFGRSIETRRIEGYSTAEEIISGREEMAGWYRKSSREDLEGYLSEARLAPGAREAIRSLQGGGALVGIASYTWSFAVQWFARELGLPVFLGTQSIRCRSIGSLQWAILCWTFPCCLPRGYHSSWVPGCPPSWIV
jgi:phosphoserine phosphatase